MVQDLRSQRAVHAERLVHLDEDKNRSHCMKIRGVIAGLDFVLSLPQTIEEWKKRK